MSDLNLWVPGPEPPVLADAEIHIWRSQLDCDQAQLRQFDAILAPNERERANRFHFETDRNHFTAARGILRELVGGYANLLPAQVEFDYEAKGKPAFRSGPHDPPIQFNVSHSGGLALFAFSGGRHLGVDIELVREDRAGDAIAERYFSPHEVEELHALPPSQRTEGFFLCWTLKEAYIKARGEGLHIPLDSFCVSFTPGQPERLQSVDSSRWSVRSFRPARKYVGAVVAEGSDWHPRYWDWRAR